MTGKAYSLCHTGGILLGINTEVLLVKIPNVDEPQPKRKSPTD
jgi:hypothetical protein